ncbi:histidine kinase [Zhouia sp. PK063]|uniref:histidine kinase n=1 Tax=Zhouia sp. PK063 TaxID=3373602 RepID=UPI0037B47D90
MKDLKNILKIGFIVGGVFFAIQYALYIAAGNAFALNQDFYKGLIYSFVYAIPLSAINSYLYKYLDLRHQTKAVFKKRLWIGIFGSVVLTGVGFFLINLFVQVVLEKHSLKDTLYGEQDYAFYVWAILTALVTSAVIHGIYFYKTIQERKVNEQKIIAGAASAQFDALKNQLDPHFLFNSLNVLTSLIEENPHAAQKFTTSLSKVYRYVLEQKNKELITVDEELKFAKTYVNLLKMRFEDSITFDIPETSSNEAFRVVPLSLQLLLENAVKHNTITHTHPLHIKIYEEDNTLVVANNLQPKQVLKKSSGVGLQNIKQRYAILTDRMVAIDKTEQQFIVKLPMLSKQKIVKMTTTNTTDERYIKARKHVTELKEFYGGLVSYVVVIPFLAFINYKTFWGFQWFWFPALGWGIGIAVQAFKLFGYRSDWEERKIREILEREERNKNKWR